MLRQQKLSGGWVFAGLSDDPRVLVRRVKPAIVLIAVGAFVFS